MTVRAVACRLVGRFGLLTLIIALYFDCTRVKIFIRDIVFVQEEWMAVIVKRNRVW